MYAIFVMHDGNAVKRLICCDEYPAVDTLPCHHPWATAPVGLPWACHDQPRLPWACRGPARTSLLCLWTCSMCKDDYVDQPPGRDIVGSESWVINPDNSFCYQCWPYGLRHMCDLTTTMSHHQPAETLRYVYPTHTLRTYTPK